MQLEEEADKLLVSWDFIDLDGKDGFKGLVALGELAHGTIVDRIPVKLVLLSEDLPVSLNDILGVLLKQVEYSDVKLFVPLDSTGVVEH